MVFTGDEEMYKGDFVEIDKFSAVTWLVARMLGAVVHMTR